VVFKKEWGNILSHIYTQHVCPAIYEYKDVVEQYTGKGTTILMEDRATSYTARITKALYNRNGIIRMKWPANSPDLNPIKNVWHLLKYQVGKRFPKTNEEVR
jgi:transposase